MVLLFPHPPYMSRNGPSTTALKLAADDSSTLSSTLDPSPLPLPLLSLLAPTFIILPLNFDNYPR